MPTPQQTKMVHEDLETIVAATLAAGAAHQMASARSAVEHYHEILEALRERGVYGKVRR
jgi:hypothetical protein